MFKEVAYTGELCCEGFLNFLKYLGTNQLWLVTLCTDSSVWNPPLQPFMAFSASKICSPKHWKLQFYRSFALSNLTCINKFVLVHYLKIRWKKYFRFLKQRTGCFSQLSVRVCEEQVSKRWRKRGRGKMVVELFVFHIAENKVSSGKGFMVLGKLMLAIPP